MKKEQMEELVITALEGGSNYWYMLSNLSMIEPYKEDGQSISERIFKAVMSGEVVPVFDGEFPAEKLGEINKAAMYKANRLMKKNHPEHYQDIINDSWDADTADVWFQLVVLKELTFG